MNATIENTIEDTIRRNIRQAAPKQRKELKENFDVPETDSEPDFEKAVEEFIHNPSLNGFDSDMRVVILFEAVLNELDENNDILYCDHCCTELDNKKVAEDFVHAYHKKNADLKTEMLFSTASASIDAVRQKWISFAKSVATDILPILEEFISTDPSKLNDVDEFPYYIKNNKIYYENCEHEQT